MNAQRKEVFPQNFLKLNRKLGKKNLFSGEKFFMLHILLDSARENAFMNPTRSLWLFSLRGCVRRH
jgi:hypothetical protein